MVARKQVKSTKREKKQKRNSDGGNRVRLLEQNEMLKGAVGYSYKMFAQC